MIKYIDITKRLSLIFVFQNPKVSARLKEFIFFNVKYKHSADRTFTITLFNFHVIFLYMYHRRYETETKDWY